MLQCPTTEATGVAFPLQAYKSSQCQHDVVRLFAGLANLTALNPALWFESSMVTFDLLGIFTLLLYLCFIQIESKPVRQNRTSPSPALTQSEISQPNPFRWVGGAVGRTPTSRLASLARPLGLSLSRPEYHQFQRTSSGLKSLCRPSSVSVAELVILTLGQSFSTQSIRYVLLVHVWPGLEVSRGRLFKDRFIQFSFCQ